ncbi:hypothetical protein V1525DRAFT_390854 [Lipomyces kononenkoae]|uniref:Uncharacterized protein n=1 Tax=Lipomyces kononenkoae TaxID=34357 RepID=A0ACC3STU3_LIPKO
MELDVSDVEESPDSCRQITRFMEVEATGLATFTAQEWYQLRQLRDTRCTDIPDGAVLTGRHARERFETLMKKQAEHIARLDKASGGEAIFNRLSPQPLNISFSVNPSTGITLLPLWNQTSSRSIPWWAPLSPSALAPSL